ncbi:cation diffusion facilitator family transporter [Jannaschia sp. S6380]|uniref:cation diffusion facilitator family transporter n=1 Tax=Jannaschia sp. S6380 TaxID=2926408 RepID=UPI001FF2982A|nr:cation diffusion facilitator family transporter [Jannaschia sp. S6380]MCK0166176.1 cation diffusion facilitator family transporter [Jannaschia sp. S6380]
MPEHRHRGHGSHIAGSGRALAISAWLTGVYFLIELAVGLWIGSVAVLSDALHTFSAVGGVLVALVAARIARRPADAAYSFGRKRAEVIGALVNGAFLLGMAVLVIVMGAMRLGQPIDLPTAPMLWVAAGGLVTEIVSLALLWQQQKIDLNVRGAYWHILQTFVGSLIIVVAAVVIRFTGFLAIDPLLGMAFGLVLLWAGWGILREALRILMDATPPEIDLAAVVARLAKIDGVREVYHAHAWRLSDGRDLFTAHIAPEMGAIRAYVLEDAHRFLIEAGFGFSTLQIEERVAVDDPAPDLNVVRNGRS